MGSLLAAGDGSHQVLEHQGEPVAVKEVEDHEDSDAAEAKDHLPERH